MSIYIANEEEMPIVFDIRKNVFVQEQHVPIEIELDEFEDDSIHFICYHEKQAVGASRLRFMEDFGKLERICVLKEYRGKSLGKQLISQMESEIHRQGYTKSKLNAQTHAISFYEGLGYKVVSDEFMDAGIPHVTMIKSITN